VVVESIVISLTNIKKNEILREIFGSEGDEFIRELRIKQETK
jgi:hypothetical protein